MHRHLFEDKKHSKLELSARENTARISKSRDSSLSGQTVAWSG